MGWCGIEARSGKEEWADGACVRERLCDEPSEVQ